MELGKPPYSKQLWGLLPPRSGEIELEGRSITKIPTDRRAKLGIAYVPQGREIIPRLSVAENLLLGIEARPEGRKKQDKIPDRIFDLFPVLKQMLDRIGWRSQWRTTTTTIDRPRLNGQSAPVNSRRTYRRDSTLDRPRNRSCCQTNRPRYRDFGIISRTAFTFCSPS